MDIQLPNTPKMDSQVPKSNPLSQADAATDTPQVQEADPFLITNWVRINPPPPADVRFMINYPQFLIYAYRKLCKERGTKSMAPLVKKPKIPPVEMDVVEQEVDLVVAETFYKLRAGMLNINLPEYKGCRGTVVPAFRALEKRCTNNEDEAEAKAEDSYF
ncbi:hypothetical protein BDV95DRAFT_612025 [Massariosphaeria phaeospora]|uniref:Uncharacterized protein n=1 Tax=Massariosphaeria phaeospora TaxID=100035 RepID=A0A7C8M1T6_9PLEO|nr:hypothetical protein BDV95DRAFT_612025 [Massariosphaeria phaeospora]